MPKFKKCTIVELGNFRCAEISSHTSYISSQTTHCKQLSANNFLQTARRKSKGGKFVAEQLVENLTAENRKFHTSLNVVEN